MYVLYKLFLATKILKIFELRKFLLHFFDLNLHLLNLKKNHLLYY